MPGIPPHKARISITLPRNILRYYQHQADEATKRERRHISRATLIAAIIESHHAKETGR